MPLFEHQQTHTNLMQMWAAFKTRRLKPHCTPFFPSIITPAIIFLSFGCSVLTSTFRGLLFFAYLWDFCAANQLPARQRMREQRSLRFLSGFFTTLLLLGALLKSQREVE